MGSYTKAISENGYYLAGFAELGTAAVFGAKVLKSDMSPLKSALAQTANAILSPLVSGVLTGI